MFRFKGSKNANMRPMLAAMVHRKNPELVADCTAAPPGQTRSDQRQVARERLSDERSREARDAEAAREMDPEVRAAKRARITFGMLNVLRSRSDIVSMQLKLWAENKDAYISIHGEDAYNRKIVQLLGKLPDPVQDDFDALEETSGGHGGDDDPDGGDGLLEPVPMTAV